MITTKINKKEWECFWCKRIIKKIDCIKSPYNKWKDIYICNNCWYYNSPNIFTEYKSVKNKRLVFWVDNINDLKRKRKIR